MSNPGDTIPDGPGSVGVQPQPKDERVVRGQTAEINRPPATNGGKGGPAYIAEQLWPLAVPIDTLTPDPANARKHGEKNMAAIRASLSRFGQRAPIVVQRQGMVIRAGNGRWLAAKAMGWTQIAAVVVDDSSIDAVAFAIADNRTAELAEWDNEVLANLLNTMPEEDMAATGFDEADLNELLSELTPDVVEDEAPEAKPNPVSKTGDLWELGEHRLLCGDSTSEDDVKRLMGGVKAEITISDPPYGIGYTYSNHDDSDNEDNAELVRAAFALGAEVKVWTPGLHNLARDVSRFGTAKVAVWFKKFAAAGNGLGGASVWEPILIVGRPPVQSLRTDVIECMTDRETLGGKSLRELHSCPKPVKLYGQIMEAFTEKGTLIHEPFCGSGTTLIAAEQLGRKCYGMEISPQYCDVIVTRWEKLTGKKATCNGKTIEQLAEERGVVV